MNILARILLFIYSIVLNTVNCILYVEHSKFCYSTSVVVSTTLRLGQQATPPAGAGTAFAVSLPTGPRACGFPEIVPPSSP